MGELAQAYSDLEVYGTARSVAGKIYRLTKTFPREETYSLVAQLRSASRSIGAQIAEAWGKRRYPRHFISKLSDADAEQYETRHWLQIAVDCGYLGNDDADELAEQLDHVGRMLGRMMRNADRFKTPG